MLFEGEGLQCVDCLSNDIGRVGCHPASTHLRCAVLQQDGFHQLVFTRCHGPVHTVQGCDALLACGARPGGERRLGRRDGAPRVLRITQPHLADDFLGARVVEIEPFVAVRRDEFSVDIDMRNALHDDLSSSGMPRSLGLVYCSDKQCYG